ncbi:MAG: S-layer homology domain-containing protein [bacterium]
MKIGAVLVLILAFLVLGLPSVQGVQLTVRLWPDRGEMGVYRIGELITIYAKANLEANGKLTHFQPSSAKVEQLPPVVLSPGIDQTVWQSPAALPSGRERILLESNTGTGTVSAECSYLVASPDAPADDSFYYPAYIDQLARGVLSGDDQGNANPEQAVTRAEFIKMLLLNLGQSSQPQTNTLFPDVPEDFWGSGYIALGHTLALIEGYPDGTFHPNNPVTKAEAITMIARALQWPPTAPSFSTFWDVLPKHWAYGYIEVALTRNLIQEGDDVAVLSEDSFSPDLPALREVCWVFLMRTHEDL